MAGVRRRKLIGHRRRVEDEGEDEGGLDQLDIDDDSLSDGSLASDDVDAADDSDTSNVEDASPTAPSVKKKIAGRTVSTNGNRKAHSKPAPGSAAQKLSKSSNDAVSDTEFMLNGLSISDKNAPVQEVEFEDAPKSPAKTAAPIVVSSNSVLIPAPDGAQESMGDRRRIEHEESSYPIHNPADPTISAPWAHDMHETVTQPPPVRQPRSSFADDGPPNGNGFIPTCPQSSTPINRKMSTEKLLGSAQIRVFFPGLKEAIIFSGVPIRQYTKLPDHRPPLRRDKPVRISVPDFQHRYVFPAIDRSFIFIPRAMRPNQRLRGKPRSGLGSIGGFSRRTSVFGGSAYGGSAYSPSIAVSRRSSIAQDMIRDYITSPTGSVVSRPALPYDSTRPVVRLPPQNRQDQRVPQPGEGPVAMPVNNSHSILNERPQPHDASSPPKTAIRGKSGRSHPDAPASPTENRFCRKYRVSRECLSPSLPSASSGPGIQWIRSRRAHSPPILPFAALYRNASFADTGARSKVIIIHLPPTPVPMAPTAAAFVPGSQPGQQHQGEISGAQSAGQNSQNPNLITQEVNGMVYYYDASQLAPMAPYTYPTSQGYPMPNVGMNGIVTPSPEGYYYHPPGVYYPQ
ncbi:hypothetical protein CIB48_g11099 [Xylaria polymorpha]|nr:hypothetical protein CIB48_g11099 [Xylaria polymorpha]